ncbi:MAG: hypothetical protein KC731_15230, partial [Myxococcales bacterium]|nr:hypothetical protein [Myxococcales bacterium]
QGGDGQGGLGQGGDGQGGLGQGGTGDKPPPWCDDASECQLHSDCCECVGEHVDLPEDECLANCFVPMCEGLQAPMNPLCEAGRCVVGYDCTTTVICLLPEPVCPAGQVPRIKDNCYQGCVPADQCQYVRNCDACTSDQLCVREPDKVGGYHCVPVPDGCSGAVGDCACAGDLACDPGETCVDVGPQNQIRCDP